MKLCEKGKRYVRISKSLLAMLICFAMVLSMLPVTVFAADTKTVYFNNGEWTDVNVYFWGGSDTIAWPGIEMTDMGAGYFTYDVPTDISGIIFNSGRFQTSDLVLPTGEENYYDGTRWSVFGEIDETTCYYVAGSFNGWNVCDSAFQMKPFGDMYVLQVDLPAGTYEFKVTDGSWNNSWGGPASDGNYKLQIVSDCTISIFFYPTTGEITTDSSGENGGGTENANYYVAGSFNSWDVCNVAYQMTPTGDMYSLQVILSAGTHEFKVTDGSWDASWPSRNFSLTATEAGTYVIQFNPQTKEITTQFVEDYTRTLSAVVCDSEGVLISNGYTVTWYDAAENIVSTEKQFRDADNRESYICVVTLGENLAMQYRVPMAITVAPEDDDTVYVTLEKTKKLSITGSVEDAEGAVITGAEVTLAHLNGGMSVTVTTDENGDFALEFPSDTAFLTVGKEGYYTCSMPVDLITAKDSYDFGVLSLFAVTSESLALRIMHTYAAKTGAEVQSSERSSLKGLHITVTGADGRNITDFEIQGMGLVFLPGAVNAGEVLTISVSDFSGRFAPAKVRATVNERGGGHAELTMAEKGSVELGTVTGMDGTALLFDKDGNCVWNTAATMGAISGNLDAGEYTLVLLEKNDLLRGAPKLSMLDNFGLTAGKDYLRSTVTVRNGQILETESFQIPGLNLNPFAYIVEDNTSVTVSKSNGLAPGTMFTVRAAYELNTQASVTARQLQLVLPQGVEVTGAYTALLNGTPKAYTYDEATRTVFVDVSGLDTATVYICCRAGAMSGEYHLSGSLLLENGVLQSLGSATVNVLEADMTLPQDTNSKKVTASGITIPRAQVTLFVDGTPIRTTANAVGSWRVNFELDVQEGQPSFHFVRAQIDSELINDSIEIKSQAIYYNPFYFEVVSFNYYISRPAKKTDFCAGCVTGSGGNVLTMLSDKQSVTLTSSSVDLYFDVKVSGAPPDDLYILSKNRYGDKLYVKLRYDEKTDLWVGTQHYTSGNMPTYLTVAFSNNEPDYTYPITDEVLEAYHEEQMELFNSVDKWVDDFYMNYCNVNYDEESGAVIFSITDSQTNEELPFVKVTMECVELADTSLEALEREGYDIASGVDGIYIKAEDYQYGRIISYADTKNGAAMVVTNDYSPLLKTRAIEDWCDWGSELLDFVCNADPDNKLLEDANKWLGLPGNLKDLFDDALDGGEAIADYVAMKDYLKSKLEREYQKLWDMVKQCPNMPMQDLKNIFGMLSSLQNQIREFETAANWGLTGVIGGQVAQVALDGLMILMDFNKAAFTTVGKGISKIPGGTKALDNMSAWKKAWDDGVKEYGKKHPIVKGVLEDIGDKLSDISKEALMEKMMDRIDNALEDRYNLVMQDIESTRIMINSLAGEDCEEEDEDEPVPEPEPAPIEPKTPRFIMDPSGFVYEAVPSNRVEGVTATIYYKGDNGKPVYWDAEDYDQINDQITGVDGAYHWDVPMGEWKVVFTKDGYYTTDTSGVEQANSGGWLPVAPPQLNINVGIVSKAAPQVELAVAYEGGIEIQFSQYMDIDSVSDAVALTRDGTPVSAIVKPMDAEYDLEEKNQYATRFVVIPQNTDIYGQWVVAVDGDAENYAGTSLAPYTSDSMEIQVKPTGISAPDTLSVGLDTEYTFSVTLEPCAARRTLTVTSGVDIAVEVVTETVITDENGRAVITVKGLRAGNSIVTITEPVSGISKEILVDTEGEVDDSTIQPVVATLEDGTVVTNGMTLPAGTKVYLSTLTGDATIRYTLNNTCPCKADALQYTDVIVLTEETMLRAAAWKDGLYSATIKLRLNVCDEHIYGDWIAVDDKTHRHSCTVCGFAETDGHDYSIAGEVLTQPALGVDGLQEFYCDCGEQILITLPQLGDVNEDGKVNMKDWNRLYEHLNEVSELPISVLHCADVNKDGKVNMKDWNRLYEHLSETNPLG